MTPEEYETVSKADIEEAERHVEWFLTMIRPLLISFSVHFKKHGREEAEKEKKREVIE